jgi:UPF0176 protein
MKAFRQYLPAKPIKVPWLEFPIGIRSKSVDKGPRMSFVVAALYHFADLDQHEALAAPLEQYCKSRSIQGTVLLATEGINGTIAGKREDIDATLSYIRALPGLGELEHKESFSESAPFFRLKVKVRNEIVTMGVSDVRPLDRVGTYVEAEDWNALIEQDDVVLIDTRNDFEVRVGQFENAVDPHTTSFTEFPGYVEQHLSPAKNKRVAMYCTGGIRCEKATSHLLEQGFEEVYHLKGGILKYLEKVPAEESKWQGECFVFDRRVSVVHGLKTGSFELCRGCQSPLSPSQREHADYQQGISCEYCAPNLSPSRRSALEERMHQVSLAEMRGESHIGMDAEDLKQRRRAKEEAKQDERRRQGHI